MADQRKPTVTEEVAKAIMEQSQRIDASPFADITVKVQNGKPVMVEIATKHKPGSAGDAPGYCVPETYIPHVDMAGVAKAIADAAVRIPPMRLPVTPADFSPDGQFRGHKPTV